MFQGLSGAHFLVLLIIILLLFAAPKLPSLAKNLGQSMRILKKEVRQMRDDDAPTGGTVNNEAEKTDSDRSSASDNTQN